MSRDQVIGAIIFICSILGILIYGWLVFLSEWWLIVLKLTGFIAVAGILAIVGWVGYTLATTPPPANIEEIEKEIEQVQKELEEQEKKEETTEEEKKKEEEQS